MSPDVQIDSGLCEAGLGEHRHDDFPLTSQSSRGACRVEDAAHGIVKRDSGAADEAIECMLAIRVQCLEASTPDDLIGLGSPAVLAQAWLPPMEVLICAEHL